MSSEKNHGRPLPPLRGRLLLKYDDVKDLDLSIFQLFDQMERNLLRRACGSDDEGRLFQQALENKIRQMKLTVESQEDHSKDEDEEDTLLKNLNQIVDLYRKRQTDSKKELLQNLRSEITEELRQRYILEEYTQVLKNIERMKQKPNQDDNLEAEAMDSSIEEEDRVIESTPSVAQSLRINTYSANKKLLQQAEDKQKKLERDFKNKTKLLAELDKQIDLKKTELEAKQEELIFKQEQIEQLLQEAKEKLAHLTKDDVSTQTEDLEDTLYNQEQTEEEESENETSPQLELTHGHKQLERDFIRHGRKAWNDKEVKDFLRTYRNTQNQQTLAKNQNQKQQLNTDKLITEITVTIKSIYHGLQDLKEELTEHNNKINMELDTLKSTKTKHVSFQNTHESYISKAKTQYRNLQSYCEDQIEKLQSTYYEIQENKFDYLENKLIESIKLQLNQQTEKLQEFLASDQMKGKVSKKSQNIQNTQPKNQIKKLIVIPNDNNTNVNNIYNILRKEPKEFQELRNIRQTKNNNIELKTSEKEIEELTEVLKNNLENVNILKPEERKMKIILLRVDKDITIDELKQELEKRKYFDSFNILKSIQVHNTNFNNWVIESSAADCRRLVKREKIKLFYEIKRVEFHIKVSRCTNCQDLNDHVRSQCEYRTRCAKCADKHHTEECKESKFNCINCMRQNRRDTGHPAYSSICPIYQRVKQRRLEEYYYSKQQSKEKIYKGTEDFTQYEQDYPEINKRSIKYDGQEVPSKRQSYKRSERNTDNHKKSYQDEDKNNLEETRTVTIRTFANSNRKNTNYKYPKYSREAPPPFRR